VGGKEEISIEGLARTVKEVLQVLPLLFIFLMKRHMRRDLRICGKECPISPKSGI
jgi:hypothetical protein